MVVGYDLSGTVAAVGKNVSEFETGEAVFAVQWSTEANGYHGGEGGVAFVIYVIVCKYFVMLYPFFGTAGCKLEREREREMLM